MVISFEEKDRAAIEAKGITVIEFKRILYKTEKSIEHAWRVLEECGNAIVKAWNVFAERFAEAVDSVEMILEVIKDRYHYSTSCRYKIVKIFSKCTGTNLSFWWKTSWKIKRQFARSRC